MSHIYPIDYRFEITKDEKTYYGTIIKHASIDEFGGDFYYLENNYVVKFNVDDVPIATYNFIIYDEENTTIRYNYIMNEIDIN